MRRNQGFATMVIGYLVSGIGGGLLAAASAVTFADPGLMVVGIYTLSGFVAMLGFGLVAQPHSARR